MRHKLILALEIREGTLNKAVHLFSGLDSSHKQVSRYQSTTADREPTRYTLRRRRVPSCLETWCGPILLLTRPACLTSSASRLFPCRRSRASAILCVLMMSLCSKSAKEDIIKHQWRCTSTPFWREISRKQLSTDYARASLCTPQADRG